MFFNGFYTVTSPVSGEHRTFKIHTQSSQDSFAPGKRIVSMLVGQDNELDYEGFGFILEDRILIWKAKRSPFFDKVSAMLESLAKHGESSPYHQRGVRVLLDKRCAKCNRKLTNPASIELGIGPECIMKG